MAKLRGSKKQSLGVIADTLEMALKSARSEKELRGFIKVVIKSCINWANEFDKPKKSKSNY